MERKFESIVELDDWFRIEMYKLTKMNLDDDEFKEEAYKLRKQKIEYRREFTRKIHEEVMKEYGSKMSERYKDFFK